MLKRLQMLLKNTPTVCSLMLTYLLTLIAALALCSHTAAATNTKQTTSPTKICRSNSEKTIKKLKPKASAWQGSQATLGLQANSGNSQATSLQSALLAIYRKIYWENTTQFQTNYATDDDGIATQQQFLLDSQTNFNITPKSKHLQFIFLRQVFTFAKFSPYTYTQNLSGGYGITAINNDRLLLKLQAGPGYLHSISKNGSKQIKDDFSANTQLDFTLYLYKDHPGKHHNTLNETLAYTMTKPFNLLNSTTSLQHALTTHFAVSVTYQLTYYSRIPSNTHHTKKTDTITNINLVYNL